MEKSINYVISNYLGERRYAPNLKIDPIFYLRKQCEFFTKNIIPEIGLVTFVLSKSDDNIRDNIFIDFIKQLKLPVKYELIVRENRGFSYGAWQDIVIKNIEYDFHFLIEDDYMLNDAHSLDDFIDLSDDETIYVCQVYVTEHCSMSNGLLNSKIVRKELNRLDIKKILNATVDNECNYVTGINNQVLFLKNFTDINYKIKDVTKINNIPFSDHLGNIIQRGSLDKKITIIPIS